MGFLFGLLVGGMLAGGSGEGGAGLPFGSIPFRCLASLDDSDESYRNCRRLSLVFEITQQYRNTDDNLTGLSRQSLRDRIEHAMNLELRGLRTIEKANKARADHAVRDRK